MALILLDLNFLIRKTGDGTRYSLEVLFIQKYLLFSEVYEIIIFKAEYIF